jgi:hypothetical protein
LACRESNFAINLRTRSSRSLLASAKAPTARPRNKAVRIGVFTLGKCHRSILRTTRLFAHWAAFQTLAGFRVHRRGHATHDTYVWTSVVCFLCYLRLINKMSCFGLATPGSRRFPVCYRRGWSFGHSRFRKMRLAAPLPAKWRSFIGRICLPDACRVQFLPVSRG